MNKMLLSSQLLLGKKWFYIIIRFIIIDYIFILFCIAYKRNRKYFTILFSHRCVYKIIFNKLEKSLDEQQIHQLHTRPIKKEERNYKYMLNEKH